MDTGKAEKPKPVYKNTFIKTTNGKILEKQTSYFSGEPIVDKQSG